MKAVQRISDSTLFAWTEERAMTADMRPVEIDEQGNVIKSLPVPEPERVQVPNHERPFKTIEA